MDLIWGRGVAATNAWVGSLHGAVISRDTLLFHDLIVARGLVFPRRFLVPMDRVRRWDNEGIFLDLPITAVLGLTTWVPEDAGPSQVAVTSRTRIALADGASLRIKGLRAAPQERLLSHLLAGRSGLFRSSRLFPAGRVTELGPGHITADGTRADLENLPAYRLDRDIEEELMETLFASEEIADTDLKGIAVRSVDGNVSLTGNVRSASAAMEADRLARSVDGGAGVDNQLITDWQIELTVGNLITQHAFSTHDSIVAHAQIGTVFLEGRVSSQEAKGAFVQAVQAVPGVQRVEDSLDVRPTADVSAADGGASNGLEELPQTTPDPEVSSG